MRRIFGSRPTRFERGDAVRLKTALPVANLEPGMVGTISQLHRTKLPSYDVQFINVNGVVGRFAVDEADLMPADGRTFDDKDVVRLRRDVPSQNLTSGTVGVVSEVSPGPPVSYVVEFVDANGTTIARTTLFDEDLASPDAAPETASEQGAVAAGPEETGLADDQLDELIAELRSQGQAMQEERSGQAPQAPAAPEPASQEQAAQESALQESVPQEQESREEAEPPARPTGGAKTGEPPSDGRTTRFVRGEAVRLETDLPSAGFEAGAEGTVTWVILGPPVSYLVEFRTAGGGSGPQTKVEETYLSFVG